MGSILGTQIGKQMDENLKKQQEFMLNTQKMQLERQMQMQLQMRQRMLATQLALTRERLYWWGGFYAIIGLGGIAGAIKMKKPIVLGLVPLIPLTFVVGYQADMAWGNKMDRVIAEADKIIANEQHLLVLPGKPMTAELLDKERKKTQQR